MNKFYMDLLETLDQTGAAPGVQLAVLSLIEKQGAPQEQEPTQEPNLLTADEWKNLGYKERLELFNTDNATYTAAQQGNFKGEKQ